MIEGVPKLLLGLYNHLKGTVTKINMCNMFDINYPPIQYLSRLIKHLALSWVHMSTALLEDKTEGKVLMSSCNGGGCPCRQWGTVSDYWGGKTERWSRKKENVICKHQFLWCCSVLKKQHKDHKHLRNIQPSHHRAAYSQTPLIRGEGSEESRAGSPSSSLLQIQSHCVSRSTCEVFRHLEACRRTHRWTEGKTFKVTHKQTAHQITQTEQGLTASIQSTRSSWTRKTMWHLLVVARC